MYGGNATATHANLAKSCSATRTMNDGLAGSVDVNSDYQRQVNHNIDTLKADLPSVFQQDISYDIYTHNILFQDPITRFKGKFNYRMIFLSLRLIGQLFFTEIHFDLHDIAHTEPDVIFGQWTVHGSLRVPWKAQLLFNGNSTYQLNPSGLIYQHIDTWDRPPMDVLRQFFRRDTA